MQIETILQEKKSILSHTANPLVVQFTAEEINVLGDVSELRLLKLRIPAPESFECSSDIFDCNRRLLIGDSIYRVLEFCMLKNRVLHAPVTAVFPWMNND